MTRPTVAVVDVSTVVARPELDKVVHALQQQVSRHFSPAWGRTAKLVPLDAADPIPESWWQLLICDNSDQAGALGYHDFTANGRPLGKVFAATDLHYGDSWSVTASHELLEMLADPDIVLTAEGADGFYAYEVCDAVEADTYGYELEGVLVSDFVFPRYFETGVTHPKGAMFDHLGYLDAPMPQILPGGYLSVWTGRGGWTQIPAENTSRRPQRAQVGSRRERRRTGRPFWRNSER